MLSVVRDSLGENLVHLWTCDGGVLASCPSWRHHFGVPSRFGVGGGGHLDVLQGSRLVLVAVEVQRAHRCLRACVITQCEVVISVKDS
jgi:hypothetical protein